MYPVFLWELQFIFLGNMAGAGRLLCSRVIFLRQWTSRKQSSETEPCFPLTHLLRKITKPLSSPWRFLKIFSGANVGKATLFQRLLSPHPPPKNRRNRGGDDRQVSQNGMPFCTGCTLFGHILNLQGSSTPFEPLVSSPKKKLRNIHWKFLHFIFGFAGECTYRILVCISRCLPKHFVAHVFYTTDRSL